jgi:hypothetical protein
LISIRDMGVGRQKTRKSEWRLETYRRSRNENRILVEGA